jgi:hypothetical protein
MQLVELPVVVDRILAGKNSLHVVVGPLVWQQSEQGKKEWYFMIATSEEGCGFRCDQIVLGGHREVYVSLIAELHKRRPIVVHVVLDEVEMARLCEILWPGERISQLCAEVEADYYARENKLN